MLPEHVPESVSFIRVIGDFPRITNRDGTQRQPARKNHSISTATAFFYKRGEFHFIGSNKHVFEAVAIEKGRSPGQFITTAGHSVSIMLRVGGAWTSHTFPLKSATGQPLWKFRADADLALLPFAPAEGAVLHPWKHDDILPTEYALELAEPVISLGYPLAFHDTVNHRPIFRHGSLASEYGIDFKGQPYFLTDAVHFPGNSGSPVITRPKQLWPRKNDIAADRGSPHCLLTGVHSRREHVNEGNPTVREAIDLGLGVTWYARLIEQLAATF